jgi:hypothetical protein
MPTSEAQFRWQVKAIASDPTPETVRSSPTHVPGLQGYRAPEKEAPWRFKCPPRAPTRSLTLVDCTERGPTRFRAMTGAIRPAAGTYTKKYILATRTYIREYLYKYLAQALTAWCAGCLHPRPNSDDPFSIFIIIFYIIHKGADTESET